MTGSPSKRFKAIATLFRSPKSQRSGSAGVSDAPPTVISSPPMSSPAGSQSPTLNGQTSISSAENGTTRKIPVMRTKAEREIDLKRLAICYIMEDNKDLKNAILIVSNIAKKDHTNVVEFTKKFAWFVFQFAEVYDTVLPVSHAAISDFLSSLRVLDEDLSTSGCLDVLDDAERHNVDCLISVLTEKFEVIKGFYPLINDNNYTERCDPKFDAILDTAITLLDIIRDGCDLLPPPFVKPAVNLACGLLKAVKKTRSNYEDMQDLSAFASECVLSIASFCMEHGINLTKGFESSLLIFTNALKKIVEECTHLAGVSLVSRFLQQGRDSDMLTDLKAKFQQAINEFQLKNQILHHSDFQGFSRIINDKLDSDTINGLPESPFFEGTRDDFIPEIQDDILQKIATWIEDSASPNLWLCGGAGLGKSSISHQLVYHLIDTGRLAAQIFFKRGSPMQKNPVTVIQTLARELASMHPKSVPDIAKAARQGGSSHQELSVYLKRYVLAPIQALKLPRPTVIVLDGLDECENHQLLLKALANVSDFSGVKIFMTSRPEISIENSVATLNVEKVTLNRVSHAKMEKYFSVRFSKMSWPGDQYPLRGTISEMATLAGGLLIWAATSCNFIENDMRDEEPYQLLQNIISAGKAREIASEDQLATLYRTSLAHLFGKHVHSFCSVFQAMLVVQVPMTVEVFAKAFDLAIRPTRAVHLALFALQIYESHDKEVVLPAAHRYHSSFLEYITNHHLHSSLNHFHIDPSDAHIAVAQKCLAQIPDLEACFQIGQRRAYRSLEMHVQYAVAYWPFHVIQSITDVPADEVDGVIDGLARDGMPIWTPFYLIVSKHISEALEGPGFKVAIDTAVSFHTHSVQLFTATGTTQTSEALTDFGLALWKRFEQTGLIKDLEASIFLQSKFLDSYSFPSIQRAQALLRLGFALRARFCSPQSIKDDLDNAIVKLTEALNLLADQRSPGDADTHTEGHVQYIRTLSALASTLRTRFEQPTRAQKDLDDAISMHTRAVEMMAQTSDTFGYAKARNGLALCLLTRYEETNNPDDLDEAISILQSIAQERPVGHPSRPSTLNNLGYSLQCRYVQLGQIEDLDGAISMHNEVLAFRPAPHQFRAQTLANIAQCMRFRFDISGSYDALDEAITKDSEALQLRPPSHPYHLVSLGRLGHNFYRRYLHTGNCSYLTQTIEFYQTVVDRCPKSHRERYDFLNDLGNALRSHFLEKGNRKDLDDALHIQRQSQEESPLGTQLPGILHDLATTLLTVYEQTNSPETLAESIDHYRQVLKSRTGANPRRSESLNGLAKALHYRFKQHNVRYDLDEALALYDEAFSLQSPQHVARPETIAGLAQALYTRFELDKNFEDVEKSIAMYEELLTIDSFVVIGGRKVIVEGLTAVLVARKLNSTRLDNNYLS